MVWAFDHTVPTFRLPNKREFNFGSWATRTPSVVEITEPTGICFCAPPAHESPVGVGWWGMVGVQEAEGSFPIHLGVI
jgi:hypothetical protein